MEDKKDKKDKSVILLSELGNNLPIEVVDKPSQEFTFRNWTMKEEKEIAGLKKKKRTMGKFVPAVLSHMLLTLNGESFEDLNKNQKILALSQASIPNMMYLWVYLRIEALGDIVQMDVDCPKCEQTNKNSKFSLYQMDINVKKKDDPQTVKYNLIKPFNYGNEKVESLMISVTKWNAMQKANEKVSTNEGLMEELMFEHSIIEINDKKEFFEKKQLIQNLSKRDIAGLSKAITDHNGGPSVNLTNNCEFCGEKYFQLINWNYDHFFGISSLPDA